MATETTYPLPPETLAYFNRSTWTLSAEDRRELLNLVSYGYRNRTDGRVLRTVRAAIRRTTPPCLFAIAMECVWTFGE